MTKRFLKFLVVGGTGFVVHLVILYSLTELCHLWYILSAIIAVVLAATNNYLINHHWTFREQQEANPNLFRGWMRYLVAIGVVETIYLAMLAFFTETLGIWYVVSAAIAIGMTSVIRFAITSKWVWGGFRIKIGKWIRM